MDNALGAWIFRIPFSSPARTRRDIFPSGTRTTETTDALLLTLDVRRPDSSAARVSRHSQDSDGFDDDLSDVKPGVHLDDVSPHPRFVNISLGGGGGALVFSGTSTSSMLSHFDTSIQAVSLFPQDPRRKTRSRLLRLFRYSLRSRL